MTVLTASQVAGYWEAAGGPKSRDVEWVAIAMGESSLDDSVVSPAGAIGTWQIMPFNAAPYGYAVADLYNPAVNARIAVLMSGGGTNCAAWDSCYANIYASGRYSFLSWPELGSADYNNLPIAAAAIGGHVTDPSGGPSYPGISGTLPGTVSIIQDAAAYQLPGLAVNARLAAAGAGLLFR